MRIGARRTADRASREERRRAWAPEGQDKERRSSRPRRRPRRARGAGCGRGRRHRRRHAAGGAGEAEAGRRVTALRERQRQAEAQRSGGRGGCSGVERLGAGQLGPPQAHHLSQGARDHGRRPCRTGAHRRSRRHVRTGRRKGSCCVPSAFGTRAWARSRERDSVRPRRRSPGPLCGRRRGRTGDQGPRSRQAGADRCGSRARRGDGGRCLGGLRTRSRVRSSAQRRAVPRCPSPERRSGSSCSSASASSAAVCCFADPRSAGRRAARRRARPRSRPTPTRCSARSACRRRTPARTRCR